MDPERTWECKEGVIDSRDCLELIGRVAGSVVLLIRG